jgi:sulfhydrogenase subunit beta (sulfur reductase)
MSASRPAADARGISEQEVIEPEALDGLVEALRTRGYRVVGPTVRDGAIVYDDLESGGDLPEGWTEIQDAASYRLERRDDTARFGFASSPHSWKQFLFPPHVRLWRARRSDGDFAVEAAHPEDARPLALLGVRACDLHAIAVQDRVFLKSSYVEPDYAARRKDAFLVAVDCHEPGGTCFCASMGTGPKVEAGYDLALTELLEDGHRFLVEVGSSRGGDVLAGLPRREATAEDLQAAEASIDRARRRMGRSVEANDLRDLLARNAEHPRWSDVAERCLTCGNCVLVCPTCFCSSVEDVNELDGTTERWRRWDTCYSVDHSYIHGGSIRRSARSRYRQWLTHKFGTWHDQFGMSGCVGCGRCITWCPVGIDVTEELAAIRVGEEAGDGDDRQAAA